MMKKRTRPSASVSDHLWVRLADELREEIRGGDFAPGQRIYTVRSLMRRTKRSMATVVSALARLAEEGLIESRRGSGMYLKEEPKKQPRLSHKSLLVVLPPWTSPNEQWFTTRILAGMVTASRRANAIVSLCQRLRDYSKDDELLRQVLDARPDGVAWLHVDERCAPTIRQLSERGIAVVTTVRRLKGLNVPLVREDDRAYARLVLEALHRRGHRSLAIIGGQHGDEYYESKFEALRAEAEWIGMNVRRDQWLGLSSEQLRSEDTLRDSLEIFLHKQTDITCLLVLFSYAIQALCRLFESPLSDRMKRMTLVVNALGGVPIPKLPTGESLAFIVPPLEPLGEQLVQVLNAAIDDKPATDLPPLMPALSEGESLRTADQAQAGSARTGEPP